ncbi:MAG: hypothetical protein JW863_20425 [Chitinispirillaceae bacterium]|nr:hypothetical protein [Chitinispirillaceae bacterium]
MQICRSSFQLLFFLIASIFSVFMAGCVYPYDPQSEPLLQVPSGDQTASFVRVFPVNGTAQICNPSIVQDTLTFPGCMLWLNFSGELQVNVPDSLSTFSGWSLQHDRLTIVDTSNTVRWFIKRSAFGAGEQEELQDPEWSAHPEYLVCLLSTNGAQKWGCYAVHPKSDSYLQLCSDGLNQTSTPHLWVDHRFSIGTVPDTVRFDEDGCADSASVAAFFGTNRVKLVASKLTGRTLSLYYRDFSDVSGTWIPLERPAGRDGWQCESPLISPDGNWIVFNAYDSPKNYEVYLQRLAPGASPILFSEHASDPHWWVHPSDSSLVYIVYQIVPDDNLVFGDLSDEEMQTTGELGITWQQRIRLFPGAATASASLVRDGNPELLVALPTKGGRSPDGRYLCTGYDRAFIVGLP